MKKTGKSPAFYVGLGAALVVLGGAVACVAKCVAAHVKLAKAFANEDGCEGLCCCCDDKSCEDRCDDSVECGCDCCECSECSECHEE